VIAVDEHLDLVRGMSFHEDQTALGRMTSLSAEKYAVLVVDTSVCHDYVGIDSLFGPVAGILSLQLVNHDRITIILSRLAPVAGNKQRVLVREVYTSFMGKWQVIFYDTVQTCRRTKYSLE
jgi:hypothetical protein